MAPVQALTDSLQVAIKTRRDSELAIGRYPKFSYNSEGGGGPGIAERQAPGNLLKFSFDPKHLHIPDVGFRTAKISGIPLPPGVNIQIKPITFQPDDVKEGLQGTIDTDTGKVDMEFYAQFNASFCGRLYRAPPLEVKAEMTTEPSKKANFSGTGQRLNADGSTRLIAIATIPRTDSRFVNGLLGLPTEALAIMSAEICLQDGSHLSIASTDYSQSVSSR